MVFTTNSRQIEKIDVKDEKIISYLNYDFEISRKKLAKELNIGEPNLNYKIQRLEDKNVLSPLLLLNFRKLGFKHYNIFLDKVSKEELEEFQNNSQISVILEVFGPKKIILEVITKNLELFLETSITNQKVEIVELLNDNFHFTNFFNIKINKNILEKEIEKKEFDTLTNVPFGNGLGIFNSLKLDLIDSKILLTLSTNPKLSTLGICKETKLNRQTVTNHIKKIKTQGLIYKKIYGVNNFTLGFEDYFLKINFIQKDKKDISDIINKNKYISISCSSYQSVTTYISVPSYRELAKFVEELESISKEVKVESFQILNVKKIENLPKIVKAELEKNK